METRGRKRQNEAEAAELAAPVETRAQKAARRGEQAPEPARAPTSNGAQAPARRSTRSRSRASQPRASDSARRDSAAEEAIGQSSKADKKARNSDPPTEQQPAAGGEKEGQSSMDRHRRDGRRGDLGDTGQDEDQDGLGDDLFGRNMSSASSTLQGILRKLGAGFDDILPLGGMSSSRLKSILAQLRSDDENLQLDGLTQLNELLAISMEDSLSVFPVEQLIPSLVSLLQVDHNPDIMLLSARALTFLADVLPSSCASIVRHGAIQAFCERLLNIEYIDLAEQSLQALEKLATEHAHACLRHGALLAVLSYIDFFQTGVQRVAVATAAHMCRGLTTENVDAIHSAVPILTNLLQYQDAKVVESASLALTRCAEALAHSPHHLEALCNGGLVGSTLQLVAVSEGGSMTSQLAVPTYYGLLRLLTTCAAGCPAVAETLHRSAISATIRKLLSSSALFSAGGGSPGSVLRSADQLAEVVSLAHALLPPLPDSATVLLEDQPTLPDLDLSGEACDNRDVLQRRKFLADHPQLLQLFCTDLLSLLLNVYNGTVVQQTRHRSLMTVIKMLQYGQPDMLEVLLHDVPISAFIAALLASKDAAVLAAGVRMAELLMLKLPNVFQAMFLKQGVVHALELLASEAPSTAAERSKPSKRTSSRLKGKGKDEFKGASSPEPATVTPRAPQGSTLRQAAAVRAQAFMGTHFRAAGSRRQLETPGVALLRDVSSSLGSPGALDRLLKALAATGGSDVSTFEFLSSGAVAKMRAYLLGEDLKGPGRPRQLLQRLRSFSDAVAAAGGASRLLSRLQEGLSASEAFPVHLSHVTVTPSSGLRAGAGSLSGARSSLADGSGLGAGLAALTQPLKLHLSRAPHEEQLRDYSMHTVLIEPLASVAAVEDFLWPRVMRTPAQAAAQRQEVAAMLDNSVAGRSSDSRAPFELPGGGRGGRAVSKVQPIPEARGGGVARSTRSRTNRAAAAAEPSAAEDEERGMDGTSEGTAAKHMILLEDDDGEDGEEDEDGMPLDEDEDEDEDMEEAELDEEDAMEMHRAHVHTVDLDAEAPRASASPGSQARQHHSMGTQTYAQAAAAAMGGGSEGPRRAGAPASHLSFYVAGKALPGHCTIFQAISEAARASGEGGTRPRRLWEETHTLQYSRIENPAPEAGASSGDAENARLAATAAEQGQLEASPLSELLTLALPEGLQLAPQAADVLLLIKALEALNRLAGHLALHLDGQAGLSLRKAAVVAAAPREEFVNKKISPKLSQQLKDVLAICGGNLPAWVGQLVVGCKFLFPFELRRRYFYGTALGLARALQHLQQQQAAEGAASNSQERDLRVSRIQRAKVRISRKRILESAAKVMEMYTGSRAVLELEYFGEPGTGLGPTLEFYTLLSHELQKRGLAMWRGDGEAASGTEATAKPEEVRAVRVQSALFEAGKAQAYVHSPQGLFPAPMHPSEPSSKVDKVLDRFKLLGRAMAKALQDSRLLDIPLSYVFYRAAQEQKLDLYSVRDVDSALGSSLETLHASHAAWLADGSKGPLLVDGAPLEDLCLTFQLPGYADYELVAGGSDLAVTAANVGDYIEAVVDATLGSGVRSQMEAFRGGFNEVFPLDSLRCFYEDELEAMLCGQGEEWTVEKLADGLKFDHGYTSSSAAVQDFLQVLSELDAADQRRFLRFVTGSPRLPPGGLNALQPRLTVVRKHASSGQDGQLGSSVGSMAGSFPGGSLGRQASLTAADGDLPSVMTCANYIKLPPYSSKAVMQARLLFAIREGQGSFDLS